MTKAAERPPHELGADGGFLVPEHISAEIWDMCACPPLGRKWKREHPIQWTWWWLKKRLWGAYYWARRM